MQRATRMLLCSKSVTHLQPISRSVTLPLDSFACQPSGCRFLCLQTLNQSSPASAEERPTARQRPKHVVSAFLHKVLDSYYLLHLLNERPWNEDTPIALQSCNAKLTPYVVSQVIRLCVHLDTALEFYRWLKTVGSSECTDSHVYVALIYRLGTAGRIEEMEAVANECEADCMVTVATFTAQLAAYKQVRNLGAALRTWKRMEKFGLKPSSLTFTTMIDVFATMKMYDEAADLYLLFLWGKFHPDVRTLTVLIHHLVMAGKVGPAMSIFNNMLKVKLRPNVQTYASLLKGYVDRGDLDAVFNLVRQFKDNGYRPDRDRFKIVFKDMVGGQREEDAMKVMQELWPELSTEGLKDLICYYKSGSMNRGPKEDDDVDCISEASGLSDDEGDENLSSNSTPLWNFAGFVGCLVPWTAATAAALEHADIEWDSRLVSEILKRINRVDVAWKFFIWIEGQKGFSHDKFTYMTMIRLFVMQGNFSLVKQLLVEAQSKQLDLPIQTYNKILRTCGMKIDADAALEVFSLLETAGLKPSSTTYQYLLHVLHNCGRFWRAATVFAEMEKAGFAPTALTYSFVVCGFAEVGHMRYARAYYSKMRASGFEPSTRIFSAFIEGFFKIGRLDSAEQVFQQMRKEGMEPSMRVYDVMIKVFTRARKKVELRTIEQERESLLPAKWAAKLQRFDIYLNFHEIFKESLA